MTKNNKQKRSLQKNLENEINFDETAASLNFAFCPTFPLRANNKTKQESGLFNNNLNENEILDSLLDIGRHFYICYSFKFDNYEQDYFFFQSFSATGFKFAESEPLFGFFSKDQILTLISQIDEIFLPSKHDKQIYDSYINEVESSADYLLAVMAEWTKLKLEGFEYLYLTSEDVTKQIEDLTEQIKKTAVSKTRKTKSKTNKNGTKPKPKSKQSPTRGTTKPKPRKPRESGDKKKSTTKGRSINSKSNKK